MYKFYNKIKQLKKIEEINKGLGKIIELYNSLDEGKQFCEKLLSAVTDIDLDIDDFVNQRKQLKEYQIRMIESKQNSQNNYDEITAQPFFNDGSFPQGKSEMKIVEINKGLEKNIEHQNSLDEDKQSEATDIDLEIEEFDNQRKQLNEYHMIVYKQNSQNSDENASQQSFNDNGIPQGKSELKK